MASHNLHDKIFKRLMSDRNYFIQMCKTYMPKKMVNAIHWDNVQLYKIGGEFVTASAEISQQQEGRADIMYLVKIQQDDTTHDCIIIFNYEHYSTPRKLIPLIT